MLEASKVITGAEHVIETIAVNCIKENGYNPNQMDKDAFDELVMEVEHLKRVAKPIVVRVNSLKPDEYIIVDGQHNFRAAKKAGLGEVLCEIVDIDDLEARIQTYKRNQHGKHDPLLEGVMFADMIDCDDVAKREVGRRFNIEEGRVRRSLKYLEAYRMHCEFLGIQEGKPEDKERDKKIKQLISKRSHREIDDYLRLPAVIRDHWFFASAPPIVSKKLRAFDARAAGDFSEAMERIAETGIAAATPVTSNPVEYDACIHWYVAVDGWLQHRRSVKDLASYVFSCARERLPVTYLDLLPIRFSGDSGEVILPIPVWTEFVEAACSAHDDAFDRYTVISARVRSWLRENGIDPTEVATPETAMLLNELVEAPTVLHDADFLTLHEQVGLFREVGAQPDEEQQAVLTTVLSQVKAFHEQSPGLEREAGADAVSMYVSMMNEAAYQSEADEEDELFADVNAIRSFLKEWLDESEDLSEQFVGDRAAAEVLAERLESLPEPELVLIRAAVAAEALTSIERRWLAAVVAESNGAIHGKAR
jgi:hypothetical protein